MDRHMEDAADGLGDDSLCGGEPIGSAGGASVEALEGLEELHWAALHFLEAGSLGRGTECLRAAAHGGHEGAQLTLAVVDHHGGSHGLVQDVSRAMGWFRRLANQGNVLAQCLCANSLHSEGRFAEAAYFYRRAAEQGSAVALANLGTYDILGTGVEDHNALEDIQLLRQAVDLASGQQAHIGDSLLHVAAREMKVDTIALLFDHPSFDELVLRKKLLFDHPSFDELVLRKNTTSGKLPKDVVGEHVPAMEHTRAHVAWVLWNILSVSRRTRAACVWWCFQVLGEHAPERLIAGIPRYAARKIVQYVLPPTAWNPGDLGSSAAVLENSAFEWRRPCLAIAPQLLNAIPSENSAKRTLESSGRKGSDDDGPTQKHRRRNVEQSDSEPNGTHAKLIVGNSYESQWIDSELFSGVLHESDLAATQKTLGNVVLQPALLEFDDVQMANSLEH